MSSHTLLPRTPAIGWPDFPGFIYYERERYDEFLQWIEEGLTRDPESHLLHEYRFLYRALHRDWTNAWRDWEYRDSRHSLLSRFPPGQEWTGRPIPGRNLLVIGEHSIGDQIMFSRWLEHARVVSGARKLFFETRPDLRRLQSANAEWLKTVAGEDQVPAFDFWIGLESLPLVTGSPEPFPAGPNREAMDVRRVGICWHGNPQVRVDRKRSTPLELWQPVLAIQGVAFRSLQYGECPDKRLEPLGPVTDFADTARRIADLDLVIAVDTAIAHLAGSLGVPVWLLSYRPPEWRWGLAGESTVWYPSMRIFRQKRRGEWESVLARVAAELGGVASRTGS